VENVEDGNVFHLFVVVVDEVFWFVCFFFEFQEYFLDLSKILQD